MLAVADLVRDYGDPQAEAMRCRQDCALFDFSFVYRMRVSGRDVIGKVEQFQPRIVGDMSIGQIRYSVKNNPQGRVRSDLTLWRFSDDVFEIMSGCEQDVVELVALQNERFVVDDLSESTAILAVQGPNTLARLAALTDVTALSELPYFSFTQIVLCGMPCLVGRLGYSGEAGFELLINQSDKERLWSILCRQFAPAGFAAIDILRIEAGFFLFTNECRISPAIAELGLSAMFDCSNSHPEIRLVAFTADTQNKLDLILWEAGSAVVKRPQIGQIIVTSACFSVTFKRVTGLGFIVFDDESNVFVESDNDFHNINLCSLPLYDPHKIRPRRVWQQNPR